MSLLLLLPACEPLLSLSLAAVTCVVLACFFLVQMTGLFEWKEQISLFQSLLTPKESQLADSACAAVLILVKDRWCEQVMQQLEDAAVSTGDLQIPAAAAGAAAAAMTAASSEEPRRRELNLRMLAFVVQTQLINREEAIAEGSERLSCVLNWLKLVLLPGKSSSSGSSSGSGSIPGGNNPFYLMGLRLLRTHNQALLTALRRLASQVDAEELLMQTPQGGGERKGPQCLLPCGAPSTADKVDVIRPCAGGRMSNAAVEQRNRLQLVCLVLREVRDLVHQAAAELKTKAGRD